MQIYPGGPFEACEGPDSLDADMVVVRFGADGKREAAFGTGGEVLIDFPRPLAEVGVAEPGAAGCVGGAAYTRDEAYVAVGEPDGRVVVARVAVTARGGARGALVRLLPDGALDRSFGGGGVWRPTAGESFGRILLTPRPDGGVLFFGLSVRENSVWSMVAVALTGEGRPEPAFGNALRPGRRTLNFVLRVDDLLALPDGRIVCVGVDAGRRTGLQVFDAEGRPDERFGPGGLRVFDGEAARLQRVVLAAGADGVVYVVDTLGEGQETVAVVRTGPGVLATAFEADGSPAAFDLHMPAPNPARGAVRLRYSLAQAGAVRLTAYDALGREVAVLADGARTAGAREAMLDGAALPAGVYLVRLVAEERSATRTVTILR